MSELDRSIFVAKADQEIYLLPGMANRHGLIAGATGTGKTVSLQVIAERFSAIGVPTFMADVKGDLAGISRPGQPKPKILDRVKQLGLGDFEFYGSPVTLWDLFGEQGHPIRATVSEMGPLLFSRLLNLNETQSGVLAIVFKIADDNGLLLLDLKDLRSMLDYVGQHASEFRTEYGNVSAASIGAVQRGLLTLEEQGGDMFFGEPALDLDDMIQTDSRGRGMVNVLAADRLMHSPLLYATFLLWMLSELYERLPEIGDPEKPRLVFFFDEAHLLFADVPNVLLQKIQQVVRLVRSKGVGVYFVTQNPLDVPDIVLGQLGNRIQHALRAYTPRDQKAVRAAAETFRANPKLDVEKVIGELAVGEALVSMLDVKGTPAIVERAMVVPPHSQIGPITPEERKETLRNSLLYGHYEKMLDRESAFEKLQARAARELAEAARPAPQAPAPERSQGPFGTPAPAPKGRQRETIVEAMAKSAMRAAGTQIGRQIIRGVLGSIFGGRR